MNSQTKENDRYNDLALLGGGRDDGEGKEEEEEEKAGHG
jgi:hypothetical protein